MLRFLNAFDSVIRIEKFEGSRKGNGVRQETGSSAQSILLVLSGIRPRNFQVVKPGDKTMAHAGGSALYGEDPNDLI